jgi:ice-binding like protein
MSNRFKFKRGRLAALTVVAMFSFAAVPVAANAAVDLATVKPFVVLGATTVTNTGPSVLNGDLGVATGTELEGFGLPAVVNGATHNNDGVANQAQLDLTTAYDVAAGEPSPPGKEMTGIDLGSKVLQAGVYHFSSSAQLTGQLTLDAAGDPNAEFIFQIGSTLTTASASSVILTNGASPCNVYWQIGSSATLDSTTSFIGNVMALTDITLNDAVTVTGRVLALNGQISLINDTLNRPNCATGSEETPTGPTPTTPTPTGNGGNGGSGGSGGGTTTGKARAPKDNSNGTASLGRGKVGPAGVRATVRGSRIKSVTFTVDGKRVSGSSARQVRVDAGPGAHVVTAKVTFGDNTKAREMSFRFRVPFPILAPRNGPSQFTG